MDLNIIGRTFKTLRDFRLKGYYLDSMKIIYQLLYMSFFISFVLLDYLVCFSVFLFFLTFL